MDKSEVEDRIWRAQRAILSPTTQSSEFLEGTLPEAEETFSADYVSLEISGKGVPDLSFCDLPGLIASTGSTGRPGDVAVVNDLVRSYISKPSCIILLTVTCETDFQIQGAYDLVKECDKEGARTIGVLTKPDRIARGNEARWVEMLQNNVEHLDNGWYCVKQPDSTALAEGITWERAREEERQYFAESMTWSRFHDRYQQRLGTSHLLERCSDLLLDLISTRLPDLRKKLETHLQATEDKLSVLLRAPSDTDPLGEVFNLISDFSSKLSQYLEGTPDADGLLQSIRPAQLKFRKAIHSTAPDFRPYEEMPPAKAKIVNYRRFVAPEFLAKTDDTFFPPSDDNAIYIDQVMIHAQGAITRELPDTYPFVVTEKYILEVVKRWKHPTFELFNVIQGTLLKKIKEFVRQYFVQYSKLEKRVSEIVADHILNCSKLTRDRIDWFLETERRPRTFNDHYYRDYRDKFFAHYKACRPHSNNIALADKLKSYDPAVNNAARTGISQIISGFSQLQVYDISPHDLARILPPDPYEAALHIMASVRAYFQVAYKRFTDNVPIAIDHELVLGLDRDHAFEKALRSQLGIHGANGRSRCAEYLQEPKSISRRRDELTKQRNRLDDAKRELMELWI